MYLERDTKLAGQGIVDIIRVILFAGKNKKRKKAGPVRMGPRVLLEGWEKVRLEVQVSPYTGWE